MTEKKSIDLATVAAAAFQPLLETEFNLRAGNEQVAAKLVEVTALPCQKCPEGEPIRKAPFSIVFHCETACLNQGTYTLEHPETEPFDLFLSPFEGGAGWCRLEALFN